MTKEISKLLKNKKIRSRKVKHTRKNKHTRKGKQYRKIKLSTRKGKGGGLDNLTDDNDDKYYELPEYYYLHIGSDIKEKISGDTISKMDFKEKNVGIMAGCFCPPHKGHYQTIYDACAKNNLDFMFIKTTNNSNVQKSRHGVPASFTIKMLSYFAKYINNKLGTQFFISNTSESLPWNINNSMKKLYEIDIVELDGEPTENDIENANKREQKDPLANAARRYLINLKPNDDMKVQYSVLFRNKSTSISATSFIKSIIKLRDGVTLDFTESMSYLPDFLNEETRRKIIKDIIKDYGEYLK